MLRPNILLDMDGVLCNFVKKASETLGHDYDHIIRHWPPGEYSITNVIGITEDFLWKSIASYGSKWWEEIEEFPWSRWLWQECQNIGETFILTQPTNNPSSLSGKLTWMKNFTGDQRFRRYMIGPQKQLCANSDNFLIDDSEKNVSKFGKNAILFPMIHNMLYHVRECPAHYVVRILKIRLCRSHKMPLASCGF